MNYRKTLTALLTTAIISTPVLAQNPLDRGNNPQPGGNPLDIGRAAPANAPASDEVVTYTPYTLKDPGMDNMDAVTLMVPKGWQVVGGVEWKPNETHFAQLVMSIVGPDGAEASVLPAQGYWYGETEMPQMPGMPPIPPVEYPAVGSRDQTGNVFLPIPEDLSAYMMNVYLPNQRPQARNARILEVTPLPELEKQLQTIFGPSLQSNRQTAQQQQQMTQANGGRARYDDGLFANSFKVQYEENGVSFIELVTVAGYWTVNESQSMELRLDQFNNAAQQPGIRILNENWWIQDGRSMRAPAATFTQIQPILANTLTSIQTLPDYQASMMALNQQILAERQKAHEITMAGIRERAKQNRETQAYINKQFADSLAERQKVDREYNEEFSAYLNDDQITRGPDGRRWQHPINSQLWQGPDGQIAVVPAGLLPPSGWKKISN